MYRKMIQDYFEVCALLQSKLLTNEYWDTNDTSLIISTDDQEKELSYDQACGFLQVGAEKIKSFFVVHCCLSNNLNLLTQRYDYSCWRITGSELIVEYEDAPPEAFTANDLEHLLNSTENKI